MDIITNIINKTGSTSTYIGSIAEWLKKQSSVYNEKLYGIINDDVQDPFVVGDHVISAQQLRDIVNGNLNEYGDYIDAIGKYYKPINVIEEISAQNSVFIIKACALEALMASEKPVECNNIFFNNLSVQLGDITTENNTYCGYISSILLSSGSTSYKVRQIINGDMPAQQGFTNTPSEEYTGINPFMGFCNNIDIDWSRPGEAIVQAANATWATLKSVYDGVVAPAVNWIKKKAVGVIKTVSDPIDVSNIEGGQDLSFQDGYYKINAFIPCPSDWIANHKDQYCCVIVLGATIYLHISEEGIDYVYVKKHMYSPDIAELLLTSLQSSTPNDWNKLSAVINSGADFNAVIEEDSDELLLYKGLLNTSRLIFAGVSLAAGKSVDSFVEAYDPFDTDPAIEHMLYNTTPIDDIASVTNNDWVNEVNGGGMNSLSVAYSNLFEDLVDNLHAATNFYPYSWVDGPLQGSYAIKTDLQNIEAVNNIVKTFITTVIVVVAGVVAIKSIGKIKTLARTAMRNYDLAYYNPDVDAATLKKLRRKANILKVLSGSSFKIPSYKNASASDNDEIVRLIKG